MIARARRRARQRGITHVPTVLEAAMVMGWFVVMIVGERTVSSANDARRSAEDTAQQTASTTSGSNCEGGGDAENKPGLPPANGSPDVFPNGMPQAQGALGVIAGLGVPNSTQTFPYYTDPLKNVRVKTQAQPQNNDRAQGKTFEGERQLGCVEKPLDSPQGSLPAYRMPLWVKNLQGY